MAKAMGKDVSKFEKQKNEIEKEPKEIKKQEEKPKPKEEVKLSKEEVSVLEDYVSGEGMWVNSYLRKKEFELNEDEEKYLKTLDNATSKDLKKEMTLFRSVDAKAIFGNINENEFESLKSVVAYDSKQKFDLNIAEKFINKVQNEVKTENGFMSTTKNSEIAEEWGGFSGSDMPIIMNISTKKDTKGIDLSKHKMEQEEVLLKRNQKYKIKKIYGKNGNIFVDVELI